MINPVEEIKAAAEMVRNGFTSHSEQVRQFGYDPDDVITELAADYAKFDANKMMLATDPRYDTNRVKEKGGADNDSSDNTNK
jgi:capsid protein